MLLGDGSAALRNAIERLAGDLQMGQEALAADQIITHGAAPERSAIPLKMLWWRAKTMDGHSGIRHGSDRDQYHIAESGYERDFL